MNRVDWLYREPLARWERWFLLGLAGLLMLLLWPLLTRVPRVYGDDSWSTMAGYTLAFEGVPRNPGQMGRGGTNVYLLQPRLLPNVVCAAVYRVVGFGLAQSRFVATLFCMMLMFASYGLVRRLCGPVAAAGTAVMTAVDPWVFLTGRTCREEIFLAALLWLSWWLLLDAFDRNCRKRALFGGLLTGLACWTHPNAVLFTIAAAVTLAVILRRVMWNPRILGWSLLGMAVGVAPYVAYVAYVQSTTSIRLMDQLAERSAAYQRPPGEMLAAERERWDNFLQLPMRLPLLMLYLWAVGLAAWRGGQAERLLLLLVLIAAVLMPVLIQGAHGRYLVVLVPALCALVWRSLPGIGRVTKLWSEAVWRHTSLRWATAGVLVVYAAMSLVPTVAILWAHRHADYNRWMSRIARSIPPDARVMAHTMYWTGLRDRQFISTVPPYFSDWLNPQDFVAFVYKHRPDYLIQSSHLFASVSGLGPRPRNLRTTNCGQGSEMVAAAVPSEILDEFYHRDFGSVRIWHLKWNKLPSPVASTATSPVTHTAE